LASLIGMVNQAGVRLPTVHRLRQIDVC
jgi:hypothetical protein